MRGEICSICCGTEREVSVTCPFECPYLQDARKHEKPRPIDLENLPNKDIKITDEFLMANNSLIQFTAHTVVEASLSVPGTVDSDVREALQALIRTYRTLQSGVYYETRPNNPLAGNICQRFQAHLEDFRRAEREQTGVSRTRDADVLGVLVFFERMELDRSNGRKRGRAFLDFLRTQLPSAEDRTAPAPGSRLIIP